MLNMSVLAQTANKFKYLLTDNSTVILTGVGVIGTVGTAVLTGRATFRAADIIAEEENKLPEKFVLNELDDGNATTTTEKGKFSKTEKFKLVWPQYIPPVLVGAGTITSIILAHRISSKQIAGLIVASTVSERAFQEYKDKVVEKLGPRQSDALREEIAQNNVDKHPPSGQVFIAGSGDVLCFEPLTGRYFNSTIEQVRSAENKVNFDIIRYDSASLSLFFEHVGLKPTDYSDMVGWNVSNRLEINFSQAAISEDGRPCLVIDYVRMPSMGYDDVWASSGG